MHDKHDTAGVIAPPPLIFAAFLGLALTIHYRLLPLPTGLSHELRTPLAALLFGAALSLMLSARLQFHQAGTSVKPWVPSQAIVTGGPYRFTRNPMYLGMTLLYLMVALLVDTSLPLALLAPLIWTMNRGVIRREERYLERKFGEPYQRYLKEVPRWL